MRRILRDPLLAGVYGEYPAFQPDALIFTGGPATVFEPNAPMVDPALFSMGIPVLGICYGQQLMIHLLGGPVPPGGTREYGKVELTHNGKSLCLRISPPPPCTG